MTTPRRTPLAAEHERSGARMVDFAGWWMPVQYVGLIEEHQQVRRAGGFFDVSHMGEIRVQGANSLAALQYLTTNDVSKLGAGQAQYSLLPNEQGGLVDDIIVYCLKPNQDYLVCVNASNISKDWEWMRTHNQGAELTNQSDKWAQIAIQGPQVLPLCDQIFGFEVSAMKPFTHQAGDFRGHQIILATTGYTGEVGCEVFIAATGAVELWQTLLAEGAKRDMGPIGLGARDTLRTEMKYSLYGHEIDDQINPYEAGLGWVIKPGAKDFVGKGPMVAGKEKGLARKLVGFEMVDKGIPRQGYKLWSAEDEMGWVTSGTHSPSLNRPIGLGYVGTKFATAGQEIFVDIRGKRVKARVCPTPFVNASVRT